MNQVKFNNEQINLKLPRNLKLWAEEYAGSHGYTNVQELIRDSIREKVFSEEVRQEYVEKLLKLDTPSNYLGEEKSQEVMLALAERAAKYKNAKK